METSFISKSFFKKRFSVLAFENSLIVHMCACMEVPDKPLFAGAGIPILSDYWEYAVCKLAYWCLDVCM